MEKHFLSKLSSKASWNNFKISQKRQRRSLHIDKGNNPSRGDNNYKDICTNSNPSAAKKNG
jgi:hypothetical protein